VLAIVRRHVILLLAFGLLSVFRPELANAAGCWTAPYSCNPGGDINPSTAATYEAKYRAYAGLAWRDFIALNFPAETNPQGKPEPKPSKAHGLDYHAGDYTAVWQTWPEARDIFLAGAAAPAAFGTGHQTPTGCLRKDASGRIELTDKIVLDEYVQAERMGPVIDKQGQYVRYGLNFNQSMFEYIAAHQLYSAQGQTAMDVNNPDRDKKTVEFPVGQYSENDNPAMTGSIFVKSSWKILDASDNTSSFYRTQAYVYDQAGGTFADEPTVKEQCSLKPIGLVGFHIVHLTKSAPQWVWSTFEHVDNGPWLNDFTFVLKRAYTFFDAAKCPASGGLPSCAFDTVPAEPWNPQRSGQTPTQLVRLAAPGKLALTVNEQYNHRIKTTYPDSVWANYFLVDVQFPTNVRTSGGEQGVAVPNPAYPDGLPATSFLSNSTMETYIPGFFHGQITSSSNPIPPDDQMQTLPPTGAVMPFSSTGPHTVSGGADRTTSSCVSCHSDAAMTTGSSSDFVFSLSRAQSKDKTHLRTLRMKSGSDAGGKTLTRHDASSVVEYVMGASKPEEQAGK
jgi:mono/diheme cytochrome c family protein